MRMYRDVATNPGGGFTSRWAADWRSALAIRGRSSTRFPRALSSPSQVLDITSVSQAIPGPGGGLGSGSNGRLLRAIKSWRRGRQRVDMTDEQLAKANRLRDERRLSTVTFVKGRIEELPFPDSSFDCVISNGVINLSARKADVFREAWRVLRPGGRLAISDIVTERQLSEGIVCNTDLWASCIGGAAQVDDYRSAIEEAGFHIKTSAKTQSTASSLIRPRAQVRLRGEERVSSLNACSNARLGRLAIHG